MTWRNGAQPSSRSRCGPPRRRAVGRPVRRRGHGGRRPARPARAAPAARRSRARWPSTPRSAPPVGHHRRHRRHRLRRPVPGRAGAGGRLAAAPPGRVNGPGRSRSDPAEPRDLSRQLAGVVPFVTNFSVGEFLTIGAGWGARDGAGGAGELPAVGRGDRRGAAGGGRDGGEDAGGRPPRGRPHPGRGRGRPPHRLRRRAAGSSTRPAWKPT